VLFYAFFPALYWAKKKGQKAFKKDWKRKKFKKKFFFFFKTPLFWARTDKERVRTLEVFSYFLLPWIN
jgi:hypothetical protein